MTDPAADARVGALESRSATVAAQVDYLIKRLDRIEVKLDALSERTTRTDERVNHLPSKEQVVKIAIGTVTVLGALVTFQGQIRKILGL